MVKKMFSHYTCCKLRDLGGQENWSKKWCQKSSKMAPKSSFGHPGVRFLRFLGGLIEVRFLMIFWAPKKLNKSEKMRRRCEKRISGARVGGTPVLPEELLEFAKSKEFVRVCNEFGTPCPLRAGGGGLLSLREFRRPYFTKTWGFRLTRASYKTKVIND